MGIQWTETPLATLSAPRGLAHPCVYRGFCVTGCSTNAKQSVLVTWLPRAIEAGAEIRDLAMVGRIETEQCGARDGRALPSRRTLALSARPQCRRRGLCDRNAAAAAEFGDDRFPDGLANSSGLVGKNLMAQSNQAVWGVMDAGDPLVQRAAVAGDHRTLELRGQGQGFLWRLLLHEPGTVAAALGQHADERAWTVGRRA